MTIERHEMQDRRGKRYSAYLCDSGHWHRNHLQASKCNDRLRAEITRKTEAAYKRGVKFQTFRTEVFPGKKSFKSNGEVFSFLTRSWDIDKARRIIAGKKRKPVVLDMSSGWGWLGGESGNRGIIRVDLGYVAKITPERLKEPLIVGTIKLDKNQTGNIILDGWHRLARARQLGIKNLPVYVLTLKETDQITV